MKRTPKVISLTLLLLVSLLLTACGLFGGSQQEREQENEAITQGADFGEIVTAEGIGANNSPVEVTDTFSSSQDYIYLVAEANYLAAGTTMFARWYYEDEPFEDSTAVTADRDYQNTYVEFHLENLTNNMEEGDYSVQLFVNGNPVETVDFTVQ